MISGASGIGLRCRKLQKVCISETHPNIWVRDGLDARSAQKMLCIDLEQRLSDPSDQHLGNFGAALPKVNLMIVNGCKSLS